MEYYWISKYDIIETADERMLFVNKKINIYVYSIAVIKISVQSKKSHKNIC